MDKIYQNLKCELLHTKVCKVHIKSINVGVLSELRRFPIYSLYYDILKYMLNYWHRLETLDSTFPILQDAYITSKTLFESKTTQASTLTYFSTCPFGQLTKKSTCLTQSFSCPKKFIKTRGSQEPVSFTW